MVYRFITGLGDLQKINPTVGRCIYTGIVTDTGSFRHATNPVVFRIVADLMDRGLDDTSVQDMIFNSQKRKKTCGCWAIASATAWNTCPNFIPH